MLASDKHWNAFLHGSTVDFVLHLLHEKKTLGRDTLRDIVNKRKDYSNPKLFQYKCEHCLMANYI